MTDFAILDLKTNLELVSIKVLVSQIFNISEFNQHPILKYVQEVPNFLSSFISKALFCTW